MPDMVAIDRIIADSRCQSRTGIGLALVQEYADAIREGAALPPLSTIRATEGYYVYDGFHRLEAYRQVGRREVAVESEPGDVWDAIERSCAVNATHGQRRTPADVKNAVKKIIDVMHHRGEKWPQNVIAEKCGITPARVTQIKQSDPSIKDLIDADTPTTVTRNGKQYEMNTANIGKKPAWQAPQMPTVPPLDPGPDVDDDYPDPERVDGNDPAVLMGYDWTPPPSKPAKPSSPAVTPKPERDYTVPAKRLADQIEADYGVADGIRVLELALTMLEERSET